MPAERSRSRTLQVSSATSDYRSAAARGAAPPPAESAGLAAPMSLLEIPASPRGASRSPAYKIRTIHGPAVLPTATAHPNLQVTGHHVLYHQQTKNLLVSCALKGPRSVPSSRAPATKASEARVVALTPAASRQS